MATVEKASYVDTTATTGKLYYYQEGRRTANAGLVQIDGAYYYIDGAAMAVTNVTMQVDETNDLLEKGTYTFGADGKMVLE